MKIEICNRRELEKKDKVGFLANTSVISITDVGEPPVMLINTPQHILNLSFDDINSKADTFYDSRRFTLNLFSKEQAEQLAAFVYEYKDETEHFICQCRWGYS